MLDFREVEHSGWRLAGICHPTRQSSGEGRRWAGRGPDKVKKQGMWWLVGGAQHTSPSVRRWQSPDPAHRDWRWLLYLEPLLHSSMEKLQPSFFVVFFGRFFVFFFTFFFFEL